MDPDVTLRELLEALEDDDFELAAQKAEVLGDGLRKGGFPPTLHKSQFLSLLDFIQMAAESV